MDDQEEASEQLTGVAIESSLAAAEEGAAAHAGERGRLGRWRHWTAPVSQAIAVSALLLGVSNALFAYCQSQDQREHDLRLELRGTIQRLTETQARFHLARQECVAKSPPDLACLGRALAVESEYVSLVEQARTLVNSVEPTSAELRAVAASLSDIHDDSAALELLRRSIEIAPNTAEKARSVKLAATELFLTGSAGDARARLSAIEKDITRADFGLEIDRLSLLSDIQLFWLNQERLHGTCADVSARIKGLRETLGKVPPGLSGVTFYSLPEINAAAPGIWREKLCVGSSP